MIKIERAEDLLELEKDSTVHPLIVKYLKDYFFKLLRQYDTDSLKDAGAIYWLKKDANRALNNDRMKESPFIHRLPEETVKLLISTLNESIVIWYSCFVINNSYVISVFWEEEAVDDHTKHVWTEDYTERIVDIHVSES